MSAIKVKVYDHQGKSVGEESLSQDIFGVEFKDALVHQVVIAKQSNARQVLAHTKGRSDVRGGGKKPWKQKGTGRARHGSIRSPLWSGGGVTFGPTSSRNFGKKVNSKMRKAALRMVLSDKVKHDKLVIVQPLTMEKAETKTLKKTLDHLPSKGRSAIFVTQASDINVIRSCKNLPKIDSVGATSLNVADILKREYIVVPQSLVSTIEKHYSN